MDAEQILKDSEHDPDTTAALEAAGHWMCDSVDWLKLAAACLDQGMVRRPQVLAAIKAAIGETR